MNECIRARELTLTTICKSCTHQYGLWRPRCPACGTETPVKLQEKAFNPPRVKARAPRTSSTQCIFCRLRAAKDKCPHCGELIHRTCRGLHEPDCQQFQVERTAAIKRLEEGVTP
jgi:predicted RNA-binding Zn-ribbon protein involved in translation (DUF1610 family)